MEDLLGENQLEKLQDTFLKKQKMMEYDIGSFAYNPNLPLNCAQEAANKKDEYNS